MSKIPASWMPDAAIDRIIFHWTAGAYKASNLDKDHYHIIIEDDGKLVRGARPISGNSKTKPKGSKASHTLNCNTGSIGISVSCMGGAVEAPFNAGRWPMTETQWLVMCEVGEQLCERYDIPISRRTTLSHAEVQPTLKIKQRGKWDIARLAFNPSVRGAIECGDLMRERIEALRDGTAVDGEPDEPTMGEEDAPEPTMPAPPPAELTRTEVKLIQTMLRDMGYAEVGEPDGIPGNKTLGALKMFYTDRGRPDATAQLDRGDITELSEARDAGHERKVSEARATATTEQLAPKLTEVDASVKSVTTAKAAAGGLGFASVIAAAKDVSGGVASTLEPVISLFQGIPGWAWGAAGVALAAVFWYQGRRAAMAARDAYREGARS